MAFVVRTIVTVVPKLVIGSYTCLGFFGGQGQEAILPGFSTIGGYFLAGAALTMWDLTLEDIRMYFHLNGFKAINRTMDV